MMSIGQATWATWVVLLVALSAVPGSAFVAGLRPAGLLPLRHGAHSPSLRLGARIPARVPLGLAMCEASEAEEPKKGGRLGRLFGAIRRVSATALSNIGSAIMGGDDDFVPMEDEEDEFEHFDAPPMTEEQRQQMIFMVTAFSRHSMDDINRQVQASQTQDRSLPAPAEVKRREMKPIVSREQQQEQAQKNVVVYLTERLVGVPDVTAEVQELPGSVVTAEEETGAGRSDAEKQPTRA